VTQRRFSSLVVRGGLLLVCAGVPLVQAAAPTAVATFHSLGLYWSPDGAAAGQTVNVRYRASGSSAWKTGQPLWFDGTAVEFRGSLVQLAPNTTYEVDLSIAGGAAASLLATTWSESFPIAETVTLPESSPETLVISRGGTKNGYVLYTHAPGKAAVIDVQNQRNYDIEIRASYVIIRGVTLKGASHHGIYFPSSGAYTDVVIEENDISGWGAVEGAFGVGYEAAIRVAGNAQVKRVIIQRNRIHHPRADTNSWCENRDGTRDSACGTHPLGPAPIRLTDTGGNHVIRYNDIYSDDEHYFYDGIGGQGSDNAGFPVRDSDVYGNYIERCWDNPIEAEGSNINTRIWGNYIDRSYAIIGITPVTGGPVYIWRNVINAARKGPFSDDPAQASKFIKSGSGGVGRVFIYHNTLLQPSAPLHGVTEGVANNASGGTASNMVARNNIFAVTDGTKNSINDSNSAQNDYDYDLYNGKIPSGKELHGIKGNPQYDPLNAAGEYALAATSPGYNGGVVLPGFNDDFVGSAPDMGAYEKGAARLEFGVNAYQGAPTPTVLPTVTNLRRTDTH